MEEDKEVWRVYAAIDHEGRVLAGVRIPERLLDRGNDAMAGAFCGWLLQDLGRRL